MALTTSLEQNNLWLIEATHVTFGCAFGRPSRSFTFAKSDYLCVLSSWHMFNVVEGSREQGRKKDRMKLKQSCIVVKDIALEQISGGVAGDALGAPFVYIMYTGFTHVLVVQCFSYLPIVRKLLDDDPGNSEYVDMEKELVEVISLTEELLSTAKQNENSGLYIGTSSDPSHSLRHSGSTFQHNMESTTISDQSEKFAVGTKVQAVWSEDGEWYDATIEALTPNGYYVRYDEWGNKEEVDPANIRPVEEGTVNTLLEAEREAEATKQALKRKIAQAAAADFQSRSLPAKLRIDPDDPEDVKAAKRKKIHAFKSKVRMEQLEVTQNKRQNAWQQFQTTKGQAKKIGFFSGRKRESIFKSPDDPFGKVGVTGSGKGLTDFQKREKHLHLKGANAESTDD
ncbi:unnamed protein product [Ilex paraguariensis]|uniref:Survival of motor neuron-related-splicing factor 30 n=1 Tax=Ilex paraguariensis TaxID=185542 RepID=A0ABC8RUM7_9AQUA